MCRVHHVFFRYFSLTRAYVIAVVMGVLFVAPISSASAAGQILVPPDGGIVPERYRVSGTITERLPDGYHLWIVVRRGALMWPKKPEAFVVGTSWETTISEGGRGEYQLVLFLVDSAGQRSIEQWLRVGDREMHFPGLGTIVGGVALDRITVQR
uniref:Uncharacterized protein n=1 Tax=Candidatus Kentrum sp. SD TaxID=2126332 RepID=A0A450YKH9_9GAMM|nr:MAG: hypothetical protein BECKSD772F_GA0070984_111210 [Candidatus Kentron sp. SD]VFK47923.1 MAG: hypothetical protein BECKSD772E_GA0070983_110910 [Candidatus Kentron sp. SD]